MTAVGFVNYDQEWWHFSYDVPGALPFDLPITEELEERAPGIEPGIPVLAP
jgi:hypothetical protein